MAEPKQAGTELLLENAPKFDNFIVVNDTWKPTGNAGRVILENGDSETENVTTFNLGFDVACDWVVKAGMTKAAEGDIIQEADGDQRYFVVVGLSESDYGKAVKQSVQLLYKASLNDAIAASLV